MLQSGDVLTEDVEFDIHDSAYLDIAEISVLKSVGDNGYLEGVRRWIADGEGYTVDGDRALVDGEVAFLGHLAVLWVFEGEIG